MALTKTRLHNQLTEIISEALTLIDLQVKHGQINKTEAARARRDLFKRIENSLANCKDDVMTALTD